MDIVASDQLPDPLSTGYWTPGTTANEEILRPNFNLSWTKNGSWHSKYVMKFKASAHDLCPALPASIIRGLKSVEIKRLAGHAYKSLKDRYQREQKPAEIQKIEVQQARRDQRKGVVSAAPHE